MPPHSVAPADFRNDRIVRRWSPRLGYGLATAGSAVVWAIIATAVAALT